MVKNCISRAFVYVYDKPMTIVPTLDSSFCRNVFKMPDVTVSGVTPDGFVIGVLNRPFPLIVVGLQRLSIKAGTCEEVVLYTEEVKSELVKVGVHMGASAYGINYEYEWLDLGSAVEEWMWKSFVNSNLANAGIQLCRSISLRQLIRDDNEIINMTFEPRQGRRDGLFASINHHHNKQLTDFPDSKSLKKEILDSEKELEQHLSVIIK